MSAAAAVDREVSAVGGCRGVLATDLHCGDHELRADEPVSAGGQASGPDPFEYLMAGLGACTTMTLRLYADRKGWPLEQVTVVVRHLARAGPGQRDVFGREIRLTGELSASERDRLLEIAERCPVGRALAAGVEVRSALVEEPVVGDATS